MNWENGRPENWKEVIKAECYDGDCVYREIDTFEAGADAMLEALKGDSIPITPKGHLIFIPE